MTRKGGPALTLFCFLLSLATPSLRAQNIIHVPGDAASIQAGIDTFEHSGVSTGCGCKTKYSLFWLAEP
jgi:hypothetical protein